MRLYFHCLLALSFALIQYQNSYAQRPRELGIRIGVMQPGSQNAITDVPGTTVGHHTLHQGTQVHTGVTVLFPHTGNLYQEKVPVAIYIGNGYGKLMGISQVQELGTLETPIVLTNTISVPTAANGLISYTLDLPGNEQVRSVNAVVGETNDGYLNDIRARHITEEHVLQAMAAAQPGPVAEGNVGAGAGTVAFGFKGGIGTASRVLPESLGGFTVGVLVQTNFGGVLTIGGVPVGEALGKYPYQKAILEQADGSCMMVVFTDAPLDARNLERVAKRAFMGLARTGGIASNGSGDYVIAVSTAESVRVPHNMEEPTYSPTLLHNDAMSPLFMATIEATEEAIINSLWAAETVEGHRGTMEALPTEEVLRIMKEYNRLEKE